MVFLKMLMGTGKIAEMKAGGAGNAVSDQGLRAIGLRCGFAQEKLCDFAHRCRFAAGEMPDPKTVIGGEPLRRVLDAARQFAGAREGSARFRRLMSPRPDQRIAEADLELKALLAQRDGVLDRVAFRERRDQGLRLGKFGELLGRREALDRRRGNAGQFSVRLAWFAEGGSARLMAA